MKTDPVSDFRDGQIWVPQQSFRLLDAGGIPVFDGGEAKRRAEGPAKMGVAEPQCLQQFLNPEFGTDIGIEQSLDRARQLEMDLPGM